jgi:hypothetical protein
MVPERRSLEEKELESFEVLAKSAAKPFRRPIDPEPQKANFDRTRHYSLGQLPEPRL